MDENWRNLHAEHDGRNLSALEVLNETKVTKESQIHSVSRCSRTRVIRISLLREPTQIKPLCFLRLYMRIDLSICLSVCISLSLCFSTCICPCCSLILFNKFSPSLLLSFWSLCLPIFCPSLSLYPFAKASVSPSSLSSSPSVSLFLFVCLARKCYRLCTARHEEANWVWRKWKCTTSSYIFRATLMFVKWTRAATFPEQSKNEKPHQRCGCP